MGSLASIEQVGVVDVPTGDLKVHWVDHWHDFVNWLVNIGELLGVLIELESDVSGGALGERSMEVWVLDSTLGLPLLLLLVGKDTSDESASVVSSKSDKHHSELWHLGGGFDLVGNLLDGLLVLCLVPHWDGVLIGVGDFLRFHLITLDLLFCLLIIIQD